MKKILIISLVAVGGCDSPRQGADITELSGAQKRRAGAPTAAQQRPAANKAPRPAPEGATTGKVIETMNSGGYTYVNVDAGEKKFWAAAPQIPVAVGDMVRVPKGMAMSDYKSTTLNRTFDLIYFVPSIQVGKDTRTGPLPAGHPDPASAPGVIAKPAPAVTAPAAGGKTIETIFAQKAALSGKPITVRGKVIKYNAGIMGKNWIHLSDGTGQPGTDDLLVTTQGTANVGDTIVAAGNLVLDKDFGSGYKFAVMIDNAQVRKE